MAPSGFPPEPQSSVAPGPSRTFSQSQGPPLTQSGASSLPLPSREPQGPWRGGVSGEILALNCCEAQPNGGIWGTKAGRKDGLVTLPRSGPSLQTLREELYLEPRPSPWITHAGPATDCAVSRVSRWPEQSFKPAGRAPLRAVKLARNHTRVSARSSRSLPTWPCPGNTL